MVTQNNPAAGVKPQPEAIAVYSYGWKVLWKPFWILLLMSIIVFAISSATYFIPFAGILVGLFLTGPLGYGMSYAYLKAARGEQVEINDMFMVFKNYWNAFLGVLLTGIIVGIGFIFLIIPGIYFACKLAFVQYLVVDKKMDVIEAIKTSWEMTGGFGWQVFLIGLLAIPIGIIGFLCLGFGVIVATMWVSMAQAALFYVVDNSAPPPPPKPAENTATVAP